MKYCPHCGAQNSANDAFCANCGKRMDTGMPPVQQTYQPPVQQTYQPPVQQTYAQTAYSTPPAPAYVPGGKVKKGQFLKSYADSQTKLLGLISLIVAVLSAVSLLAGALSFMCADIRKIPAVKNTIGDVGFTGSSMEEYANASLDEMVEEVREAGVMDGSSDREVRKVAKAARDLFRTPSLMNAKNVMKLYQKNPELSRLVGSMDESAIAGINALMTVGFFLFAIPALFAVLGGTLKSVGWSVAALICAIFPLTTFALPGWMILGFILLIGLIVVNVMLTNKYKSFRAGV